MGARAQVTKRSKKGVPSGLVVVLIFWHGWHAGTILYLHLGVHLPSGVCTGTGIGGQGGLRVGRPCPQWFAADQKGTQSDH